MTAAQRTRAADVIERKGQTVTIAGTSSGTYNTATSSVTGTPYSKTVKAALLPLAGYRKVDGTNIKAGDETLLIAGLDTSDAALPEPPINSIVTLADGTTKKTLVMVSPLAPAGLNIIYDAVVRGNA